jgi:hypothetical protein
VCGSDAANLQAWPRLIPALPTAAQGVHMSI